MRVGPAVDLKVLGTQKFPLGTERQRSTELSASETSALFTALRRGTNAHLGREATVKELVLLKSQISQARQFLAEAEQVLRKGGTVHFEDDRPIFVPAGDPGPEGRRGAA